MHGLKKLLPLLLLAIICSCQTTLEKKGWTQITIDSQLNQSTFRKDKELALLRIREKSSYHYFLSHFKQDTSGKIRDYRWSFERSFKSDTAYSKWESDSACLVKLLSQGKVQASLKLRINNDHSESFQVLNESQNRK